MPALRSLSVSLLVLLLLPAHTLAEPTLGGAIRGSGTASTFTFYKDGTANAQGGLHRHTLLCTDCVFRITVTDSDVTVVQDGQAYLLPPGSYEVREFQGVFGYNPRGLGNFTFDLAGSGRVHPL